MQGPGERNSLRRALRDAGGFDEEIPGGVVDDQVGEDLLADAVGRL